MHKQLHTQVTVTNQWIIIINSTDMYDSTATNHCIRKTFMQTGSKPHPPIIAFNPFTDNNYFIIISISQAVVSMKIDPFPHSSQPSSHPRSVLFCQTSSFASPCLLNLLKVWWIHICIYTILNSIIVSDLLSWSSWAIQFFDSSFKNPNGVSACRINGAVTWRQDGAHCARLDSWILRENSQYPLIQISIYQAERYHPKPRTWI